MSWDVQVPFLSEMSSQIMDDDDTALDGGANVGSVNLWMHSLFSDVSVSLNENLVSPPTMGKQLVNFITCGCESSAPFL
jgi:hypothetical protein